MGALTFKPLAFQFRPWETTTVTVANYVEGVGSLVFHQRGTQVFKITSPGWLQDQTRFAYDGFRRQRLVTPVVFGQSVGWAAGVAAWLSLLGQPRSFVFRVDPFVGLYFFWWLRLYHAASHPTGVSTTVAVDTSVFASGVYHGGFGLPGAATTVGVVLPAGLPYEEDGLLAPPVGLALGSALGVAQLFGPANQYTLSWCPPPRADTPATNTLALFQVSPLQRLLREW